MPKKIVDNLEHRIEEQQCRATTTQEAEPSHERLDLWRDTVTENFVICAYCKYYTNARCRRHAPRASVGYPAVYPEDWCGDQKPTKTSMGGH